MLKEARNATGLSREEAAHRLYIGTWRTKVLRLFAAGYQHQRNYALGGVEKGERQMIPEALNRDGFITNLKEAHTRLLILKEDIKYPLSEERQNCQTEAER